MVAVKITHLSKTYRGYRGFLKRRRTQALQELDLEILKGEVLGLLGLNAAGKTTVLKILMGLIQPTKGEFKILGKKGIDKETRRKIGYLPENANLYEFLTASEFLNFCGKLFSLRKDIRQKKSCLFIKIPRSGKSQKHEDQRIFQRNETTPGNCLGSDKRAAAYFSRRTPQWA